MPWRLPVEQLGLFPPTELHGRAATAAGVRLAFRSDTTTVSCLVAPQIEEGQVDLYCDGEAYGSASVCCVDRFGFEGMPAGDKLGGAVASSLRRAPAAGLGAGRRRLCGPGGGR